MIQWLEDRGHGTPDMPNRGREDVETIDNAAEARRPDDTMA
jgi:hypothetical protein